MLEFQPVRREDWLPPHPQVRQPQTAEPRPLDAAEHVTIDYALSSDDWQAESGGRVKLLAGKTVRASFWDLSNSGATVNITAPPRLK